MVAFEFTFDEALVKEMFERHHRTRIVSYVGPGLRVVLVVCVLLPAVWMLVWLRGAAWLALLLCVPLLLFPARLQAWLAIWTLRKSPYYNEHVRVELDGDGFTVHTDTTDMRSTWAVCTSAVWFDGVMLFHGPRLYRWLPFRFLVAGSNVELEELVHAKIAKHRLVK